MTPSAVRYEYDVSQRPLGRTMDLRPAPFPHPVDTRQTADPLVAPHPRRHLLCPAHRLRLALSACQLPTLADGVLSLQAVPPARYMATALYHPPPRGTGVCRPPSGPECQCSW